MFVLLCVDKPDSADLRRETRERHLAYVAGADLELVMAGPLIADDGETMQGSLFIFDSDDEAAVRRFHARDPYTVAGLFAAVEMRRFRKLLPR